MRTGLRLVTTLLVASLVVAACGTSTSAQRLSGGKASFAEQPNAKPNYLFPLMSGKYFSVANISQFSQFVYRPLYWFGHNGKVELNEDLSLAKPPVYTDGGKTVTITLKGWKWSDGTQITSRDIEFWQNLLKGNTGSWGAYSPGAYPDNIVNASYPDPMTAVFTLDKAYGSYFYTFNELSQITPMPQHVWDKTSDSGAIGDWDRTDAGAKAIYKFLDGRSQSVDQYGNDPLWQVVSGPWKIKSMDSNGNVAMVPNPGYSGPIKPSLAEFDEQPYTTDTAEFNVVRSGGVDLGYIPLQDVNERGALASKYTFAPWTGWEINYIQINFQNTPNGVLYSQLYFRQTIQHLVDQDGFVKNIMKGFGYTDFGPVPTKPPTNFADSFEKTNPYPFDVTAASNLLKNNGWTVNPGGISTCSSPGTGSGQCGNGIKAGQKASLKLEYASGLLYQQQEVEALKSDLSKVGIDVTVTSAPFDTVIGNAFTPSTNSDVEFWGGGWVFSPDYYPTGDEIFSTGAGSNGGGYTSATNDTNTAASTTSSDLQTLYTYQDFLAKDLPVIWFPVTYLQLTMAKNTLHGWDPQDPTSYFYPENWYLTAS